MKLQAPTLHTCHGILSHKGRRSTDLLGRKCADYGLNWRDCNYGDLHSWQMRSRARLVRNARRLVEQSQDGDHVAAHSYGALVAIEAMRQGRKFGQVFLFHPCADSDVDFTPGHYGRVHVIYNPDDLALLAAELLPFHPGGGLGRQGYRGESPEVVSVSSKGEASEPLHHSTPFVPLNLQRWAWYVVTEITKAQVFSY